MSTIASSTSSSFELAPAGVHPARCVRVIDLGTQKTEWQGQQKLAHKIMVTWELLGDERMEDGRPFTISTRYTLSLHEKARLTKDLQAWRSKAFTPAEIQGFDVKNVLGAYCQLSIIHTTAPNGNEYANIAAIMPLPKSMGKPDGVNPLVYFDIDAPDAAIFETFGEKLRATIESAPEWKKKKANGGLEDMPDDLPWKDESAESIPF